MDYKKILMTLVDNEDYKNLQRAINYVQSLKAKQLEISKIEEQLNNLLTDSNEQQTQQIRNDVETYYFERRLSGANFGNHYVQEKILRKLDADLHTGDYVRFVDKRPVVVDHDDNNEGTEIICFEKALVEYDDTLNCKILKKYADGGTIKVDNMPFVVTVNPDAIVNVGDVIDYAFYRNDAPLNVSARHGTVRWVYPAEKLVENVDKPKVKKEKKPSEPKAERPLLDMNLNGQTVLIISDYAHSEKLESIVYTYNGVPTVTGGPISNEDIPPMFSHMVKSYDIVIICTDYIHHAVSQAAIDALKEKENAKYAISSSSSDTFIERALYRAENHLQAYEASGESSVEYPVKSDEVSND